MVIYRQGQVWEVNGRKSALTIRLLEDADMSEDNFFKAEIIDGQVQYMSQANKGAQDEVGLGTQGTVESFRTSLTKFEIRHPNLERVADCQSRDPYTDGMCDMKEGHDYQCTTEDMINGKLQRVYWSKEESTLNKAPETGSGESA